MLDISSRESSMIRTESGNYMYNKIALTDKSKITLVVRVIIISLCCIFFPLEAIIDSRLEDIETDTYIYKRNVLFIGNDGYQKFVNVITTILGTNDFIMVYISIVYIIIHPFIGLKLILVCCNFQYLISLLQAIFQANRPFWATDQVKTICNTSYPNPSSRFFFCCFFFVHCFLSYNQFNKKKLKTIHKIILLVVYLVYVGVLYFLFATSFFLYHHQIVYNIILSTVVLILLISFDTKIYNFIFKFLKNLYNTRVYKMKIFYFVILLYVIEYILLTFFDDKDMNKVKDNLSKNTYCSKYDIEILGTKAGILNNSFLVSLIGAFWGAAFTVEKKLGKWWSRNSTKNIVIKVVITVVVCAAFTTLVYLLRNINDNFNVYLSLKTLVNFLESYCIFGLMPLLFQRMKINDSYRTQSYEKINLKLTNDQDYQMFSKSIFTNEQGNKSGVFVAKDKGDKGKDKEKEKEKEKEKKEKEKKNDDENKNLIEDEKKKENSNDKQSQNEDSKISIDENKKKEKKENVQDVEPISMIINNLFEIKEEEGDLEFNVDKEKDKDKDKDKDKENKQFKKFNELKEGLLNIDLDDDSLIDQ